MPGRIAFVVNRSAGAGNPPVDRLARILASTGAEVRVHGLGDPDGRPSAIRDAFARADAAVIGGGDGTINRLVGEVMERGLPLGVIPLGTANDLARTLGIPADPERAAELVTAGGTRAIDVGLANDVPFVNAAGVGLSVDIGTRMSDHEKSVLGVTAYARHLLRLVGRGNAFHVSIDSDSIHMRGHVIQVTIANGRHYGGGMTVREDADIDDGVLDVLLVRPRTALAYLRHFMAFRSGRYRPGAPVSLGRARSLRLRTRGERDVSLDGEVRTRTPLTCRIAGKALTVFVP